MDARTLAVRTIFGQDRRHIVPLFQRPYVWTQTKQWEPLWEDLRNVADRLHRGDGARAHFMGAVVFDQIMRPTGKVESRLIIDGQQRLTTIQIVLEALADIAGQLGNDRFHKALLKLTRNDDPMSEDPDDVFKVWPTNVDQQHFRRVMEVGSPEELRAAYKVKGDHKATGNNIADSYLYFYAAISEWLSEQQAGSEPPLDALFTTLRDYVRMVVIDLEREDDPQLIFETLNARGSPLLPSDLVKNHLFHKAELEGGGIEDLYKRFWKPFDDHSPYWRMELGRGHARRARIDTYLQHYLTLKTQDQVSVADLYTSFRDYATRFNTLAAIHHLQSLRKYADIYEGFDAPDDSGRKAVFFRRLAQMDTTTIHPFLLELFAEHEEVDEVDRSLGYLESFLVRRMVCQLNTRGYGKLFIDLLGVLASQEGALSDRVHAFLLSSDAESNRWPEDPEFQKAWIAVPLYRVLVQGRVRLLLEGIEDKLTTPLTEKMKLADKLAIEHLMPQGWRQHWSPPAGDPVSAIAERDHRLDTIGNLTLLTERLNPSVSNAAWPEKKPKILKHSALALNRELQKYDTWDDERIEKRSIELFDVAKKVWPGP